MKNRYRIVYCEGNLDRTIGGSYFSLLFLVSGLDKARFDPIVVFRQPHMLMDRFSEAGVRVVIIPPQEPVNLGLARDATRQSVWLRALLGLQQAVNFLKVFVWDGVTLAWWLLRERADLVHLNNSVTRTHSWMLAAKLIGIPCITHERGINTRYSSISRYFAMRLARVVCISKAVYANLRQHDVGHDNLVVVYNGIDPGSFVPARPASDIRQELHIPAASPVIGIVGNLRSWKGQDVVVKAVGRLKAHHPGIVCMLVGDATPADARFRQYLDTLAIELSVQDQLRFTGYKNNVADYVNAMDVVIHASVDPEPFGRVLIEAMSLGKPVVGSRAGAVPEILDHPNCGLTFQPGDHEELASLVDELLTNPTRAESIGRAARQSVRDHFGLARNVRDTERIYTEILERD